MRFASVQDFPWLVFWNFSSLHSPATVAPLRCKYNHTFFAGCERWYPTRIQRIFFFNHKHTVLGRLQARINIFDSQSLMMLILLDLAFGSRCRWGSVPGMSCLLSWVGCLNLPCSLFASTCFFLAFGCLCHGETNTNYITVQLLHLKAQIHAS